MAVLKFVGNGNYLENEAAPHVTGYRSAIESWARSYTSAMFNISTRGVIAEDYTTLPEQIDLSIFNTGIKPNDDQITPIMAGINWGRLCLFADMGTGKTFMSGYMACHWMKHSDVIKSNNLPKRALVVCPKGVIPEWTIEIPKFFAGKTCSVYPDNQSLNTDFVVTNYEQVENLVRVRDQFSIIILDESQRIKNMDTGLFDSVSRFVDAHIWHRITMTGTPVMNEPLDLFTQISLVNPEAFPFSYANMLKTHFSKRHLMTGGIKYQFRAKSKPLFRAIVAHNAIAIKAAERSAGRTVDIRSFGLNSDQEFHMEAVRQGHLNIVSASNMLGTSASIAVELKNSLIKESQISSGYLMAGNEVITFASPKLAAAYDIVTKEFPKEQAILWCYFRHTVVRLREALLNAGVPCEAIVGGVSNNVRKKVTADFKSGKIRVVILQLKACNSGLNLQNCALDVFVELDWSPATIDQAMARTDRQGQTRTCQHVFLYSAGTVDELYITAYKNKRKISSSMIRTYAEQGGLNQPGKTIKMTRGKQPADKAGGKADFFGVVKNSRFSVC